MGLAQNRVFVRREVDHAVADDHVNGRVRQRHVLHLAFEKLDIPHAGLARVFPRQLQHFVRHVQSVGLSCGAYAPGREQHIDAPAGAEVEDGFSLGQSRDRDRVATAERGDHRLLGQVPDLVGRVKVRTDGVAVTLAAATATVGGVLAGAGRRLTVALSNLFFDRLLSCHGASLSTNFYIDLLFHSDSMASSWTSLAVIRRRSIGSRIISQAIPAQQRHSASTNAARVAATCSSNSTSRAPVVLATPRTWGTNESTPGAVVGRAPRSHSRTSMISSWADVFRSLMRLPLGP